MKQIPVILAIDQGTTGSRALLYNAAGALVASAYQEFTQFFPKPGWVEHDPEEIWDSVQGVMGRVMKHPQSRRWVITAIGITNQRETTVLWDSSTGRPVHRALVWQDRRTTKVCEALRKAGHEPKVRSKTGLVLDPYFSASKIQWMLEQVPAARTKARQGRLAFGTIDSWLLWKLTGGKVHATDPTNASRTMLFNIRTKLWDRELIRLFKLQGVTLPEVRLSASHFGVTSGGGALPNGIPIHALVGDQQAALYGQACYHPGQVKNTYGTGCFAVMNVGTTYHPPPRGLLATLACDEKGRPVYALEGSVFIGGAVIQWLRDGLGFFKKAVESEKLARQVKDTGGVILIPAFVGLGSPYWNPNVRGVLTGITRGTTRSHVTRAALESIAQQSTDVFEAMQGSGIDIRDLKLDGGATSNRLLMQFQADLLGIPVHVSEASEATAWGAAKMAGIACGFWKETRLIDRARNYRILTPKMPRPEAARFRLAWKREVEHLLA